MMKVFLDTNLILEYLEKRREYMAVSRMLNAVEDGLMEILSPSEFVEKYL